MKSAFRTRNINVNNEKYLVETVGYKLKSLIYGSTTTAIATLISLAKKDLKQKSHQKLPQLLVLWSYQKKIT